MPVNVSPNLARFFGDCFHADWDRSGQRWQSLLEKRLEQTPPSELRQLFQDLCDLLENAQFTEDDFEYLLFERFSMFFDPRPRIDLRQWLEEVLKLIEDACAK